jgi:hypothetical protein
MTPSTPVASIVLQTTADTSGDSPFVWLLRIVVYGACLGSLSVYAYRLWRRFAGAGRSDDSPKAKRLAEARAPQVTDSPTAKLFREVAAERQLGPTVDAADAADAADADGAAADGADRAGSAPAADDRRGLFARQQNEPGRPLPEVLAGVALPCDLVPVVADDVDPAAFQAFSTHSHPAAEVGAALGDELERLGFTLRSRSDIEAVASRGSDHLFVSIIPSPRSIERGGNQPYRSLPASSVVVELSTELPA